MKILTSLLAVFVLCVSCVNYKYEVNINLKSCVPISYNSNIIGSGVIVSCKEDSVYILTAKHVAVIPDISVIINNEAIKAEVIYHTKLDIALLKCTSASLVAPVTYQISNPRPLEIVYTVGYPLGIGQVITTGIINHSVTNISEGGWLCSSPAMPGNSGGGVFNSKGELLGITVCIVYIKNNNTEIPVPHLQVFIPINIFSEWLSISTK